MKVRVLAVAVSFLMLLMMVAACSGDRDKTKIPTEPSGTKTTQTAPKTSDETEPTRPPMPTSAPVVTKRVVDKYGQLQVIGNHLCDQEGNPVQLRGMSTHGLQFSEVFINYDCFETLARDWGCDVIRVAMYTQGAYIREPDRFYNHMVNSIEYAIDLGVYVMVDWHILSDGNPQTYQDEAIEFFDRISAEYGDYPNIIYELCNEPNSGHDDRVDETVTWDDNVKPYAEALIPVIRANDPNNIIIIGSPDWSKDVHIVADNPVEGDNLMYAVHFYAGSHGQELRDNIDYAMDKGLALFVTEWGTTNSSGSGSLYFDASDEWLAYLDEHMIGWCNWSIGGSVTETSNALKWGSRILEPLEKIAGHWPDEFITSSGLYVRDKILEGRV